MSHAALLVLSPLAREPGTRSSGTADEPVHAAPDKTASSARRHSITRDASPFRPRPAPRSPYQERGPSSSATPRSTLTEPRVGAAHGRARRLGAAELSTNTTPRSKTSRRFGRVEPRHQPARRRSEERHTCREAHDRATWQKGWIVPTWLLDGHDKTTTIRRQEHGLQLVKVGEFRALSAPHTSQPEAPSQPPSHGAARPCSKAVVTDRRHAPHRGQPGRRPSRRVVGLGPAAVRTTTDGSAPGAAAISSRAFSSAVLAAQAAASAPDGSECPPGTAASQPRSPDTSASSPRSRG